MTLLVIVLVLPQKIFVMPNMDDIWLPIMHSAMDTRSNANLVTVTNDALKDPEPEESEVSVMWRLLFQVYNDRHFITMTIWRVPVSLRNPRCSNGSGQLSQPFYPCYSPVVAPVCGHPWSAHKAGSVGELVIICGKWQRIVTHRLSSNHTVLFVWHQIVWLILRWNTIHGACRDCLTNVCGGGSTSSHLIQPEEP